MEPSLDLLQAQRLWGQQVAALELPLGTGPPVMTTKGTDFALGLLSALRAAGAS